MPMSVALFWDNPLHGVVLTPHWAAWTPVSQRWSRALHRTVISDGLLIETAQDRERGRERKEKGAKEERGFCLLEIDGYGRFEKGASFLYYLVTAGRWSCECTALFTPDINICLGWSLHKQSAETNESPVATFETISRETISDFVNIYITCFIIQKFRVNKIFLK